MHCGWHHGCCGDHVYYVPRVWTGGIPGEPRTRSRLSRAEERAELRETLGDLREQIEEIERRLAELEPAPDRP
ncbi:MAG: hypothetical protein AB7U23_07210 [Dehalococcoidia bacterium]